MTTEEEKKNDGATKQDLVVPMEMTPRDLYGVLNVSRDATIEDLQLAYKNLSRTFHPDKQWDEESKKKAQEVFVMILNAYDTLRDPVLRRIYDRFGHEGVTLVKRSLHSADPKTLYPTLCRLYHANAWDRALEVYETAFAQYQHQQRHHKPVQVDLEFPACYNHHHHNHQNYQGASVMRMLPLELEDGNMSFATSTGSDRWTLTAGGSTRVMKGMGTAWLNLGLQYNVVPGTMIQSDVVMGSSPNAAGQISLGTSRQFSNGTVGSFKVAGSPASLWSKEHLSLTLVSARTLSLWQQSQAKSKQKSRQQQDQQQNQDEHQHHHDEDHQPHQHEDVRPQKVRMTCGLGLVMQRKVPSLTVSIETTAQPLLQCKLSLTDAYLLKTTYEFHCWKVFVLRFSYSHNPWFGWNRYKVQLTQQLYESQASLSTGLIWEARGFASTWTWLWHWDNGVSLHVPITILQGISPNMAMPLWHVYFYALMSYLVQGALQELIQPSSDEEQDKEKEQKENPGKKKSRISARSAISATATKHETTKRDAEQQRYLMTKVAQKKQKLEQSRPNGLVILQATYWLFRTENAASSHQPDDTPQQEAPLRTAGTNGTEQHYWDATIPLQFWVCCGKLSLPGGISKSRLLGFCDLMVLPPDENDHRTANRRTPTDQPSSLCSPQLTVRYQCQGTTYEVTILDEDELQLPHPGGQQRSPYILELGPASTVQ